MATRSGFRPRPLDISRPLPIVRDVNDLDPTDATANRDISNDHEALKRLNEEVSWLFC